MPSLTAIIPTRGNLPLSAMQTVCEPLARIGGLVSFLIADNSAAIDLKLFAVYALATAAQEDLIYTQDDDVVVSDPMTIAHAHRDGKIVCNMPLDFQRAYEGRLDRLMGFGSCFERSLIRPTFDRYFRHFPDIDALLLREAHRIFTALNHDRIIVVDVPKTNMPYCSDSDRLWRQPDHATMHREALRRVEFILKEEGK